MNNVPEGYMKDAQDRLVPISTIKQIDLERDALVNEIVANAKVVAGTIETFKEKTLGDVSAFVQLSAEKYNVRLGGDKGNVALTSFDGRYKIQRDINEYQVFDERLHAAKALIDECITDWSTGSRPSCTP